MVDAATKLVDRRIFVPVLVGAILVSPFLVAFELVIGLGLLVTGVVLRDQEAGTVLRSVGAALIVASLAYVLLAIVVAVIDPSDPSSGTGSQP